MKANTNLQMVPTPRNYTVWIIVGLAVVAAAVVLILLFVPGFKKPLSEKLETTSDFQAVFLDNGQVYFGKLSEEGQWLKLTDVYYLQVEDSSLQAAGSSDEADDAEKTPTSTDIKLVKLGSELHGPEDTMHIDRGDVLFWENMKENSKVMEAIKDFKNK